MDRVKGRGWEVKCLWCPDGLFHGLSLEHQRSVMNSNLRVNMRDVCVFTGAHLTPVIFFSEHFRIIGRKIL